MGRRADSTHLDCVVPVSPRCSPRLNLRGAAVSERPRAGGHRVRVPRATSVAPPADPLWTAPVCAPDVRDARDGGRASESRVARGGDQRASAFQAGRDSQEPPVSAGTCVITRVPAQCGGLLIVAPTTGAMISTRTGRRRPATWEHPHTRPPLTAGAEGGCSVRSRPASRGRTRRPGIHMTRERPPAEARGRRGRRVAQLAASSLGVLTLVGSMCTLGLIVDEVEIFLM